MPLVVRIQENKLNLKNIMDHVVDEIVNAMVNTKVGLKTIEDVLQTEQLKATLKPKVDVWYFGEPPREIIPINTENSETSLLIFIMTWRISSSQPRELRIYMFGNGGVNKNSIEQDIQMKKDPMKISQELRACDLKHISCLQKYLNAKQKGGNVYVPCKADQLQNSQSVVLETCSVLHCFLNARQC